MLNHKYSTYGIILFIFLLFIGFAWSLDSSDVDELCEVNESFLFRYNDTWMCGNISDMIVNYTVNNITNNYINWSLHAHEWDNLDSPDDLLLSMFDGTNWIDEDMNFNGQDIVNLDTISATTSYLTNLVTDNIFVEDWSNLTDSNLLNDSFDEKILANRSYDVTFDGDVNIIKDNGIFNGINSLNSGFFRYLIQSDSGGTDQLSYTLYGTTKTGVRAGIPKANLAEFHKEGAGNFAIGVEGAGNFYFYTNDIVRQIIKSDGNIIHTGTTNLSGDTIIEGETIVNDVDGLKVQNGSGTDILEIERFSAGAPDRVKINVPGLVGYFQHKGTTMFYFSSEVMYMGAGRTLNFLENAGALRLSDNIELWMGNAGDTEVVYNTTDFIIDPDRIGSGSVWIGITGDDDLYANDLTLSGNLNYPTIYCEASDLADQPFGTAGDHYRINITTTDEGNGITMNTGTNGTNITIDTSGVYHMVLQPQVQAGAVGGGKGDFHMWLEKDIDDGNGFSNVAHSNIELSLGTNEEDVIVLATTMSLDEGTVIRAVASVSDDKILLHTISPANEPIIPSIIFTMYRVGS